MTRPQRETLLADTFVTLADTLVAGYDLVDLLQTLVERSVQIVDADAAGILLADDTGRLEVVASTDESSRLVDLMQLRAGEGPCVEAFLTGQVVEIDHIEAGSVWPLFSARALESGYASVHSVPMRLRAETIGALNLFRVATGRLSPPDAEAARALADIATIGILHERAFREADVAREQLQRALDSRVVIEQAKGFIAHVTGADMNTAFQMIRTEARNSGRHLQDVAHGVLDGSVRLT